MAYPLQLGLLAAVYAAVAWLGLQHLQVLLAFTAITFLALAALASQLRRRGRELERVGLGLALVKELTSALGGNILLDSAPGTGSSFQLRLPPLPV